MVGGWGRRLSVRSGWWVGSWREVGVECELQVERAGRDNVGRGCGDESYRVVVSRGPWGLCERVEVCSVWRGRDATWPPTPSSMSCGVFQLLGGASLGARSSDRSEG